jgi:hypothetical protein
MPNPRRARRKASFTDVLIEDVVTAIARMRDADNPIHRREAVRSIFAAIEGFLWQLKQDVYSRGDYFLHGLSVHEQAAILEEAYVVDGNGNVRATPRFLPLATNIRLVVSIIQRYRPNYKIDFGHRGWSNLKTAIEIRHRLVHPKSLGDLIVTTTEVHEAISAFSWVLALVIEVLRESVEYRRDILARLKTAKAGLP